MGKVSKNKILKINKARSLYLEGYKAREAAKILGISIPYYYVLLRKAGAEPTDKDIHNLNARKRQANALELVLYNPSDEQYTAIYNALKEIEPRQDYLIMFCDYYGMAGELKTYEQIAQDHNISRQRVHVVIRRILRLLRKNPSIASIV